MRRAELFLLMARPTIRVPRLQSLETQVAWQTLRLSFNGYSLYGPFAGWNTKLDGTGTSYLGGDTFVMGTSNVALYAIFPKLTYTVTYDANGASSGSVPIDSTRYAPDELVTVFGNTGNLAKNGFAFVGWNTDPSGNGVFYSGGSYFGMGPSNLVLYADWQ